MMLKYTIKRLLRSLFTVFIVVTLVFLMMRMLPTDYYFTEEELLLLTQEQQHDKLMAAGLLDPVPQQLMRFYKNLFLHFDFGTSRRIQSGVSVMQLIGSRIGYSIRFGSIALVISLSLGLFFGVVQARHKDSFWDHVGTGYTIFVNAVPALVSYSLILMFGARVLRLPSLYSVRKVTMSSIMPIACLALGSIAGYMVWIRRYMVDELNKDYLKLAQIKGMSMRDIMFRHVLKNAFVPMAQNIPASFLMTITGSILMERFFAVPGMGPLLAEAIGNYDVNVVQGLVTIYALMSVLGVFLGDVLMCLIDPRIRLTAGREEVR